MWKKLKSKFKFDLSNTEDKLKLIILVSGTLLFLLVATAGAIQATMTPNFCQTCHVMTPEYQTWAASSHSKISCTECHIGPGLGNLVTHKVGALKELYHYVTGSYEAPLKMKHALDNSSCEQCHSVENRLFTPSGDLIIPHERHMTAEKEVLCVDCHNGVAHGKISGRGMITEGDPGALHGGDLTAWTFADGQAQMAKDYTKADMNDCIKCHVERQQTMKCEACHTAIKTPDNHYPAEQWKPIHGLDATKDINSCKSCHTFGFEVESVSTGNKAQEYAWGNQFCASCHSTAPKNHNAKEWRKVHGTTASAKGEANCNACHSYNDNPQAPTSTACTKCHMKK